MKKLCPYCKVEKPIQAFYNSHKPSGHPCKACNVQLTREWRANQSPEAKAKSDEVRRQKDARWRKRNQAKISQERKRRYARNPTTFIEIHYKSQYGITLQDKRAMCERQNWSCAICGADLLNLTKAAIDHCHTTKVIRGILCTRCNTGMGLFRDNPEFLARAITYLEVARGRKEAA